MINRHSPYIGKHGQAVLQRSCCECDCRPRAVDLLNLVAEQKKAKRECEETYRRSREM